MGHGVEKGNGKYNQIHFRRSGINKEHNIYSNPHSNKNKNRKSKDNFRGYNKFVKTTRRHKREEPKQKVFIKNNKNEYDKKHSPHKNYKEYNRIHLPMDRIGKSKQIFWNAENIVKCNGLT